MFSILQRTIFIELFRVFFLCWLALTSLILVGGVIAEATQQGLGPSQILQIIPFLIPSTMPYTLPTTTLFATCVVYGRLAHDNEVLAVKAAGIHLFQIVKPAFMLGFLASAGTFALYWDTIPRTHWDLRTHFVNNLEDFLYGLLNKDGCIRHPQIDFTISVKRVEGRKLIEALFLHRDPRTRRYDLVARGREAELKVDMEKNVIRVLMWHGSVRKENDDDMFFEYAEWPVDMGTIGEPKKERPTDMPWPEMSEYREKFETELARIQQDIARHEVGILNGTAPLEHVEHVKASTYMARTVRNSIANIDAEYQMRPALSLGCLCFVLVGCPVGIWFSRSDYLSSFITCFLPIVLIYYPLMLCGINMAKSGKVMAALAIWPANVLIAISAFFLIRKLLKN